MLHMFYVTEGKLLIIYYRVQLVSHCCL